VLGPEQVEHHFADHRIVFHQQQPHQIPRFSHADFVAF
jgi:hypothetical protein